MTRLRGTLPASSTTGFCLAMTAVIWLRLAVIWWLSTLWKDRV